VAGVARKIPFSEAAIQAIQPLPLSSSRDIVSKPHPRLLPLKIHGTGGRSSSSGRPLLPEHTSYSRCYKVFIPPWMIPTFDVSKLPPLSHSPILRNSYNAHGRQCKANHGPRLASGRRLANLTLGIPISLWSILAELHDAMTVTPVSGAFYTF